MKITPTDTTKEFYENEWRKSGLICLLPWESLDAESQANWAEREAREKQPTTPAPTPNFAGEFSTAMGNAGYVVM